MSNLVRLLNFDSLLWELFEINFAILADFVYFASFAINSDFLMIDVIAENFDFAIFVSTWTNCEGLFALDFVFL